MKLTNHKSNKDWRKTTKEEDVENIVNYNIKNGIFRNYGIYGFKFIDYVLFNIYIILKRTHSERNDIEIEKS